MKKAPKDISDWMKIFEGSALYRHDNGRLFDDWLELCICCVANGRLEERYLSVAKRYTKDELDTMAQLFGMLILLHEEHQDRRRWYDALGQIYEHIAGRSKTSRMGQFFTPPGVCDVSALISVGRDVMTAEQTILDPACGSGRMLLSAHAMNGEHGLLFGADLDPMCAKMCALNFWLHGIRGEVACMDSLTQQWYFAYQVHPRKTWPFITLLGEERKHESLLYTAPPAPPPPPVDLFSSVHEEAADYGEPFLPCSSCGQYRSDTCVLIQEEAIEVWSTGRLGLECPQCHAAIHNSQALAS